MSILKKTDKDAHNAIKWVAGEYKYIVDFQNLLDNLKDDIDNLKHGKKDVKKTREILKQIGWCERKAKKYEEELDKDLKNLLNKLPADLRQECENIEKNLRIAMDSILKNTSMYVGELKKMVKGIEIQIDLLSEYGSNRDQRNAIYDRIDEIINIIKNKVSQLKMWVSSMSKDLKQAEKFEMQLAA